MCNAVAVLFLAQGVPLLYEGDETGDSQNGNNNVYCQDNPTGWVNWKKDERYAWFREFVARMAAFRREHPVLAADMPKQLSDAKGTGYPDLSYHGENAWISELSGERQSLGMLYCGKEDGDGTEGEEFLYVGCNFHMGPTRLALPKHSREEKVVSAEGHRQRAGTVPKRGGAGGCAADRTLRSVCRYINRKIRLHYYESMETFLHDQPSQASGHERLFCSGVIQTGIIT